MILVVGGLGYIGRRVVEYLASRGEVVRVLDRAEVGGSFPKDVEIVRGDAAEFSRALEAMRGVRGVVNLAAHIDVHESLLHPQKYIQNNFTVHLNILEAARRSGVEKIVLASSAAVYGDASPPLREDAEARPTNPYGLSKLCCEILSQAYHSSFGTDATILRYFNVLGEGGKNVLKIFVENAMAGKPLVVRGRWIGGEFIPASRDFIYVGDVADATVKALSLERGVYKLNIGSGRPVSVRDLAELVLKETGCDVKILLEELSHHEPLRSWADITNARQILGWMPTTSLESIVKKYVKWYRGKK
ncbi:UDP-glucose 4-epimerase [Candidatus Calditenuaceae archaeon HR02]|nr:UDP-glucose 4-epimerase [Candidatus Calditenuaceae archaeon HR02]